MNYNYNEIANKKYVPKLENSNNKNYKNYIRDGFNQDSFMEDELLELKTQNDNNRAGMAMRKITNVGIDADNVYDNLSKIFFSEKNLKRIQKSIKDEVYKRTKGQYKLNVDQDDSDLTIAMRAVLLEHGRFLPFNIKEQIIDLNNKTVESIIPDMITNLKQAYAYIKEINEPIKPMMRPINVNNAGRRTLPSLTTIYGF